jgi:hypothetical protein
MEAQEVEALLETEDTSLLLVEDQTPRRQPPGQPRLDLKRLLPGVAVDDEIIGLCRVSSYAERWRRPPVVAGAGC